MCHAPIVLPEIAGEEFSTIEKSTRAMERAAEFLISESPEVLVVLSPHTPRLEADFVLVDGQSLYGDFGDFGFFDIQIRQGVDAKAASILLKEARGKDVPIKSVHLQRLDHGAMVPLYFMQKAGWKGPTVVIGFPMEVSSEQNEALGQAITNAARKDGRRWAVLASGDMSHRLIKGAPAGFHPRAKEFDAVVVEAVGQGKYKLAVEVKSDLRECAAEDVIDSLEVAASVNQYSSAGHKLLNYECPFGVGYLIAILNDGSG
jgi:AmmeMemoRadiSam system protein B